MASSFVTLSHLSKSFGARMAVEDVSFEVKKGEVLGFLGPNGAGKTTTMRMITGYLLPDSGSVEVCGKDMCTQRIQGSTHIGYLPEGGPLYPDMTPWDFLHFITGVRMMEKNHARTRIDYVIDALQLSSALYQPIETLSKGFKRRVCLAQAIVHDPDVLILDEPTDGLDPLQKHEVRQLIRSIAADKAIIFSTHILEEVEAICTRALIIARGKIVARGTPAELASLDSESGTLEGAFRKVAS